mgnify:CR=1 FL=1
MLKDGCLVYEKYFRNCTQESRVHVYSVTKSVISILIGIALDKGYIKSTEQKVLDFFPDYQVKKGEQTIQEITLKHLLSMTAPYKYRIFPPYVKYFTSGDWVKFSLDVLGGRGKIGTFWYAPLIGPDILSGILVRAAGQSVLDFAAENLFSPLGIPVPNSLAFRNKEEQMAFNRATDVSGWAWDQKGIHAAGWGLSLSPIEMAKLGQLYLNGGVWEKRRIVSEKWVADSTAEQSFWKRRKLSYGYLWWRHEEGYAAMGDGGNLIYVNTKKKLVVAIGGLLAPGAGERMGLVKQYVEPVFEEER